MQVLVSSSLVAAVTKFDPVDAKRVWSFLDKFKEDPSNPGISLERIEDTGNANLWSGRISQDLRAIIYKDGDTWLLLHADRHDPAYAWARSRQIGRHVRTGAMQIVEPALMVDARLQEPSGEKRGLFDEHEDDYLLSLGVPTSWLPTIRKIKSEETLIEKVCPGLPADVSDRLLSLAMGEFVVPPLPVPASRPSIESEDTQRSFLKVEPGEDFLKLLSAPLATWIAFLHPSQRRLASGSFNGPVKVSGSAGTGKTVVAMHRARYLARQGKKVLFTTFETNLCKTIKRNLGLFCTTEELSQIVVTNVHSLARRMIKDAEIGLDPIPNSEVETMIRDFSHLAESRLSPTALAVEWAAIIQARGIRTWEEYRRTSRAGRGTPLTVSARKLVWAVFEQVFAEMKRLQKIDFASMCGLAAELVRDGRTTWHFDSVIVDEVQDLGPQELKLLAALAGEGSDRLMIAGDGGQRIYASRFSLKSLGIDVRGRSYTLRLNYRTSDQIRLLADRVIGKQVDDLGEVGKQREARSLFSGPPPVLKGFESREGQVDFVCSEIVRLLEGGLSPDEIAVFAREGALLTLAIDNLKALDIPCLRISKDGEASQPSVMLGTMHRAKGLEFKAVFVIDANHDQLPNHSALDKAADEQAKEDVFERERQLLYVSMTRARDLLFVTWVGPKSQYLYGVMGPDGSVVQCSGGALVPSNGASDEQ